MSRIPKKLFLALLVSLVLPVSAIAQADFFESPTSIAVHKLMGATQADKVRLGIGLCQAFVLAAGPGPCTLVFYPELNAYPVGNWTSPTNITNPPTGIQYIGVVVQPGGSLGQITRPPSGGTAEVLADRLRSATIGGDLTIQAACDDPLTQTALTPCNKSVNVNAAGTGSVNIGGNLSVSTGVTPSLGMQHIRASTGSCGTAGCSVTVTWSPSLGNTNYTVVCTVQDSTAQSETAGLRFAKIRTKNIGNAIVDIDNLSGSAITGTVHCMAMRDQQ